MNRFLEDLRYAIRMLRKSPGLTCVAALSLALGIGANSAMFSAADALLFRPLLLPDIDRVVTLFGNHADHPREMWSMSGADYLDIRGQARTLDPVAGYRWWTFNITGDGEPETINAVKTGARFFEVLGVQPAIGRSFLAEEEEPGRDLTAILSDGLWQRRYGRDPGILGRTIQLDGTAYKVVGVMPPQVRYPPETDVWVPWAMTRAERGERGMFMCYAVGRLKEGVSLSQAQAEAGAIGARISAQYPLTHTKRGANVSLIRETISGELTAAYTRLLLWAVGFVLLIACANVANLLLSRITARSREFAIRSALGASRWRLVRQLLTESVALSLLGGAAGLVLAMWGVDALRASMPATVEIHLPGWRRMGIHTPTLLYTLAIAVLGGVVAGLAPALVSARAQLTGDLKSAGRGLAGSGRHILRNVFVVAQIVLAVVLLVGAGLLVKGASTIATPAPGSEPEKVLAVEIALPERGYSREHERGVFAQRLIEKLRALPGVASAGLVSNLPYSDMGRSNSGFLIEGRPTGGESTWAQVQSATSDYFQTARIPLRQGRFLSESDGEQSPRVVVISEMFARRHFPGENPVGRRIRLGDAKSKGPWLEIVGVAGDIRHNPYDRDIRPVIYRPFSQGCNYDVTAALRARGDPRSLMAAVREHVRAIDSNLPIARVDTWKKLADDMLCGYTYVVVLIAMFGLLALVLAATGVYSVMAYAVSERTQEIGVRMALGADQKRVVTMIVGRGMTLAGAGLGLGVAGGLVIARLLASLLFGVGSADVSALIGVTLVIAAAAVLACWVPARRAARVDPMIALRYD